MVAVMVASLGVMMVAKKAASLVAEMVEWKVEHLAVVKVVW